MLVNSVDYSGMLFLGDADLAYLCMCFVNDLEIFTVYLELNHFL